MRTIIWFIYFWITLLGLIPPLKKSMKAEQESNIPLRNELVSKHVSGWAGKMLKMAGVTVDVLGKENITTGAVVYAGNHQGNFDIPTLLTTLPLPCGFIAKVEIEKMPLIRSWMRLLGCIFIDRDDMRQSVSAMQSAAKMIKNEGRSVIIFPEGTRSKGGEIGEFKNGVLRIATKSGAPIVPFAIEGSYKAMEQNKNFIRPAHITISFLPAINHTDMTKEEKDNLSNLLRDTIVTEHNRIKQL